MGSLLLSKSCLLQVDESKREIRIGWQYATPFSGRLHPQPGRVMQDGKFCCKSTKRAHSERENGIGCQHERYPATQVSEPRTVIELDHNTQALALATKRRLIEILVASLQKLVFAKTKTELDANAQAFPIECFRNEAHFILNHHD